MHFSCLLSVILVLMAEAQKSGCDLKHSECLDEQVFVQLRSEVSDSKDSDTGVAAHPHHPRWRRRRDTGRRRFTRFHPYHPYGPTSTTASSDSTSTSTTTSTSTSPTTIQVCEDTLSPKFADNNSNIEIPTPVLLNIDAEQVAGCCIDDSAAAKSVDVFIGNSRWYAKPATGHF